MVLCPLAHTRLGEGIEPSSVLWSCRIDNCKHLPFNLVKDVAYGDASLDELQLHHCAHCEECSEIWASFNREAQLIQRAKALRVKSEEMIAHLLKEHPPKSNAKSA